MNTPHKCPICNGTGSVPAGFYSLGTNPTTSITEQCRLCTGIGVVWHVTPTISPESQLPSNVRAFIGKHKLELNILEDGRIYLNYWDWAHGRDVICQVIDGKLFIDVDSELGTGADSEISFQDFLNLVIESISKISV